MDATRFLWHQRLCTNNINGMGRTSKVVNGIPHFSSENDLDGCDILLTRKTRIITAGHVNIRGNALKVNQ